MSERKSLSPKIRFEVFKRDRFTCQYCGGKAPDVVLHCDHIQPVADGGANDLMNLVTACAGCNGGKGARSLDDMSVVERQRRQIEELEERRQQLEMMLKWREGLADISQQQADAVAAHIASKSHFTPNDNGLGTIRKWSKKYQLNALLDAIDASFEQYLEFDSDRRATAESWERAFAMIPRIISTQALIEKKPYMRELFYIRGILRRRLGYVNERMAIEVMERAHLAGIDLDDIKELSKMASSWSAFRDRLMHWTVDMESEGA
jgi:cytochrome c553